MKSTVQWGLRASNKNVGSYVNILQVLLHPVPWSLLYVQEPEIRL